VAPAPANQPDKSHPEWFYEPICKGLNLPLENCVTAQTFDGWVYRREFGQHRETGVLLTPLFISGLNTWAIGSINPTL
jgi:hypothetical protein